MTARSLTAALGGRWHGSYGTARCPAHDDRRPSLSVRDGNNGDPIVHCFSGCDWREVRDELRRRGLIPDDGHRDGGDHRHQHRDPGRYHGCHRGLDAVDQRRIDAARAIWRASQPATDSPVEVYLQGRGIKIPPPPSIRYHGALKHRPTELLLPAMVAAVQVSDRRIVGVHRTFLRTDGTGKAAVTQPKMMLGPCAGGAVRLATADQKLAIGEGIETMLSVQQATGLSCWAALSTSGLKALLLPSDVREVVIFADGDAAGEKAAQEAADRFVRERRRVRIARPPRDHDFNDVLMGHHQKASDQVANTDDRG